MTLIVPAHLTPRQQAKRDQALRVREATAAHQLLEHVGLPRDPDCALCAIGRDPLTIGDQYDAFAVDAQREWLTRTNRERVMLAAALYADIEEFERINAA